MVPNQNLNELICLKPTVIRFIGKKFPDELWKISNKIKRNKKIST